MNKFFSKTVKKSTLWAVIMAIVVAAAIVVCALFGFNQNATLKDNQSLTVSVDKYYYNTQKDLILQECENAFNGEEARYVLEEEETALMEGEIVFVFDKDVNVNAIKANLATRFAEITKADSGNALAGSLISVSATSEVAMATMAKHFILRSVIASVVFAVLAFGYIAIRHANVMDGLWVGGSVIVSMLLATALIILCRVPVTTTVSTMIAVAGLLTAVVTVLTLNKVKNAKKEDPSVEAEERIVTSIPVKESICLFLGIAVAIILVGALGGTLGIWFALSSLLALAASAFVSLIAAPAAKLCLDSVAATKPVKNAYVGAKKTSKKEKKVYEKKAPVEETAEEEPAAEVEEVSEELVEEEAEVPEEATEEVEEIAEEPALEEVAEEVENASEEK